MDKYKIAYEDKDLLIVDKVQGLATGIGEKENLTEIIFTDYPVIKTVKGFNEKEGGLLNRLDNETGGFSLKTTIHLVFTGNKWKVDLLRNTTRQSFIKAKLKMKALLITR